MALAIWALVFLAILAYCIHSYTRLRHFPGPRVAAVSKLWMLHSTLHGRMHLDVAEACRTYGESPGYQSNTYFRELDSHRP